MSNENRDDKATDAKNEDDRQARKRTEQKRMREKRRRSDLSKAFDEMAALILQVEPESGEPDADAKRRKTGDGAENASGVTRLELMGRAINTLRRLHSENEERKRITASFQQFGVPSSENPTVETYPIGRVQHPPYARFSPQYYHGSNTQSPGSDYYQQAPSPQYHLHWGGHHRNIHR